MDKFEWTSLFYRLRVFFTDAGRLNEDSCWLVMVLRSGAGDGDVEAFHTSHACQLPFAIAISIAPLWKESNSHSGAIEKQCSTCSYHIFHTHSIIITHISSIWLRESHCHIASIHVPLCYHIKVLLCAQRIHSTKLFIRETHGSLFSRRHDMHHSHMPPTYGEQQHKQCKREKETQWHREKKLEVIW